MSVKRLISKLTKENLWIHILAELSKRPMYAYEISKILKEKHKISVVTVTTYVVLYKMSREGLISKIKEVSSKRPGRKYYAITEKGLSNLEEGKRILRELVEKLDTIEAEAKV